MIEFSLMALIIGDWFFINRENIIFAFNCVKNKWIRRNELI